MITAEGAGGLISPNVIAAGNGPAESGKGEAIKAIQAAHDRLVSDPHLLAEYLPADLELDADDLALRVKPFDKIDKLSCGDAFRALTAVWAIDGFAGELVDEFDQEEHSRKVWQFLNGDIGDFLQTDAGVRETVSTVGSMPGSQGVAGTIFREQVKRAYFGEERTLIIMDARDPVDWLLREEGLLGTGPGQIDPRAILPFYVDTSAETAAKRSSGDYEANLERVLRRRGQDEGRDEYPFTPIAEADRMNRLDWQARALDMGRTAVNGEHYYDNNQDGLHHVAKLGEFVAANALLVSASHDLAAARA